MAAVLFNTSEWVFTSIFLACVWNQLQTFSKKVSSSFKIAMNHQPFKRSTLKDLKLKEITVEKNGSI